MKKRFVRWLIALTVCVAVLVWSWVQVAAVGSDLQYLVTAPQITASDTSGTSGDTTQQDSTDSADSADTPDANANQKSVAPNQGIQTLKDSLVNSSDGWSGAIEVYTFSGVAEKESMISDTGITKEARLTAVGDNAFTLTPKYPLFGRLFYREELRDGCDGILLDEKLALALFQISEPIGRTVTISGVPFTVLGIVRHTLSVGDSEDYGALVTLPYLINKPVQLQALQVTARPVVGAGASSAFSTVMNAWCPNGTLINLGKEGLGTLLPIRVLLFFLGCAAFFSALRYWNGLLRGFIADTRQKLKDRYLVSLLPRLIACGLGFAVGYAVLAFAIAMLISYIVQPVYTFTEWVPSVLVEWKDIRTAFWNVWQGAASLQELRSPELCRLRYFAQLIGWFSAGMAVTLAVLWMKISGMLHKPKLNDPSMQ